ncbi:hypothetical protein QN277_025868 [Acacia crassicarpa]|uniref:Uncharacterized protein n=1 Tax=Acacia crassicarpa TaxID=499986 RepID=A0AAE1J6R2_9FABA|nr:hypothetical protein QN277_025868 [Acacia crassicarpa]
MAPLKKSKINREKKKLKKLRQLSLVHIEPRTSETDWCDSSLHKNSTAPEV